MQGNLRQLSMPRTVGAGCLFLVALAACTHVNHGASPAADATVRSGPDARPSSDAQTAAAAPDTPPAAPPAAVPPAPAPAAANAKPDQQPKTVGTAKPKSPRGPGSPAGASSKSVPAEQRATPAAAAPPVAAAAPVAAASTQPVDKQPAPAPLDLTALEQRLKDTHAIGVFTKLSLKNQVDDLLDAFRSFHGGQTQPPLAELRQRYDLLLLKVLTLLQDGDPPLASAISASREAIWALLADRNKFQKIQVS
jgi:hypothetical protein